MHPNKKQKVEKQTIEIPSLRYLCLFKLQGINLVFPEIFEIFPMMDIKIVHNAINYSFYINDDKSHKCIFYNRSRELVYTKYKLIENSKNITHQYTTICGREIKVQKKINYLIELSKEDSETYKGTTLGVLWMKMKLC